MLVDDVVTLVAAAGLGTAGTDLFKVAMPAHPDTVTVFTETGGFSPQHAFGTALPIIEFPRLQVRTRGAENDPQAPRTRIERVYQLLVQRGAETVSGGARYLRWNPILSPSPLGQDENRRWMWVMTFEVWKEVSSL